MIDTPAGVALAEDSPHPRVPGHDRITRSAAAAAYLSVPLCESVLFTFFGRPGRAWGPSIGIDPVAVVRHAVAARRRRRFRDVLELGILTATVVVVVARLASRHGLALTASTVLVLALLVAGVRLAAARVGGARISGPRAAGSRATGGVAAARVAGVRVAGGRLRVVAATAFIGAGVVTLAGTIMGWAGLVTDLAVALAGIALAWLSLVVSVYRTRRRAALIRDAAGRTAELGRPLTPAIEERLRESARADIVVYAASRAALPFVGSGQRIRDWELAIDVTRGAGPVAFTTAELDEYLDLSFIDAATEHLSCLRRLYVDGRTVRPAPDEPLQHLGLDVALAEVAAEDDSSRRVYFCLQQTAREGEIVVSLFVRPRLEGRVLRLEIALHALLPLAGRIANPVARLSSRPVDILGRSMSIAGRLLPGPIGRLRGDLRQVRWQAARRRQAQRAGRRGRPFDVGATITVREGMSTDDLGALPEIVAIGASLQHSLLTVLRAFLVEHRIDTSEFDRAKESIATAVPAGEAELVGFGADFGFTADE